MEFGYEFSVHSDTQGVLLLRYTVCFVAVITFISSVDSLGDCALRSGGSNRESASSVRSRHGRQDWSSVWLK